MENEFKHDPLADILTILWIVFFHPEWWSWMGFDHGHEFWADFPHQTPSYLPLCSLQYHFSPFPSPEMVYNAKISAFVSCLRLFIFFYFTILSASISSRHFPIFFTLHTVYPQLEGVCYSCFTCPLCYHFKGKLTVVLSSLRHCYKWVCVYHWTFVCILNRRLNCGLKPCVYSIDCQTHCPTIFLCSGIMKLHTQTHGYPGIHSLRHIGGCTCTCEHKHTQTNINPIPLAVCLQNKAVVCMQHNEVYLYCRVIHDSLSWCWTLSK